MNINNENISPNRGKGKAVRGELRELIYSDIVYLKTVEKKKISEIVPQIASKFKRSDSTVYRIYR